MRVSGRIVAALAVVALVAGGAVVASRDRDSARADVTVAGGGTVEIGPARFVLTPNSVTADATLSASIGGPPAVRTPPEGPAPRVTIASDPVTVDLAGSPTGVPATVTFEVDRSVLPNATEGVWLARAAPGSERWTPVGSRYDPASGTVTAQGEPTGSWAVWTWDLRAIEAQVRAKLAAFGSGRAARVDCPGFDGVRTETVGTDPILLGCPRAESPDSLVIDVTGNRGYSMVLQVSDGVDPGPPVYSGFAEFVRNDDRIIGALGGRYLAPAATMSFRAPARGDVLEFRAAPSAKTHVLDLAIVAAEAAFGVATAGYADCILDAVARSGPAPLRDAPGLVLTCFPVLAQASSALRFYAERLEPVSNAVRGGLALFDETRDRIAGETGLLRVVRPSLPPPSLYVSTGYQRGALYPAGALPSKIGINNHDYVDELRWTATPSSATATGTLNELVCVPSCADGLYRVYDVEVVATAPRSCPVPVYADGSDAVRTVDAYAYTRIVVRKALPDPSPDPVNVGDAVISGACR